MITILALGIGFLAVLAILVGIVDAAHAAVWRSVAEDRREMWEARHPQYHGIDTDAEDED